nr:cytochrome P450 [Rhizobium ruizarguesonis]
MQSDFIPDHVPSSLVMDFSSFTSPGMAPAANRDPHAAVSRVHREIHIFYSSFNTRDTRGTWVITGACDQRKLPEDVETFSSHRGICSSTLGENWPMIPLEHQPLAHGIFRALLDPQFSLRGVMALERNVRQQATAIIDLIARSTSCDVMKDQAQVQGCSLTDGEVRGIGVLFVIAELDTVAAALGFDLVYLARNLEDQESLRREPTRISTAVEELLRAYSTVQIIRVATKDGDFEGVSMRKGDFVSCASMIANRDPAEFMCPDTIDLAREDHRHIAFGYGPHLCLGANLARREIAVGIHKWLTRIPTFRSKGVADDPWRSCFGLKNLILICS